MNSEVSMRSRIAQLVSAYPGLHLREVARQLDTSVALVEYHVPILVSEGVVDQVEDQRQQRLFPAGSTVSQDAIMALRDGKRLQIVLQLLAAKGTHADLVARTGLGKSTLSFHLRRLENAGLVTNTEGNYAVQNPVAVRELVRTHRPTPNLLQRFAALWSDLYDD